MVTDIYELVPQGYSLLLIGPEGSGKTTFSLQWIIKGCNEGKHGIYVTFDEMPSSLRRRAKQMGGDLQDLEEVGLLTIIDGFYPRIGIKSKETFTTRPDVDYLLLKVAPLVTKSGTSRLVIDSITSLLTPTRTLSIKTTEGGEGQNIKQKVALIRMSEFLKSQGITTIYTEVEAIEKHRTLDRFLVDGIIELKLIETEEGYKRRLLIKKMRGKEHPMHYIDFKISEGQGIGFK
jgi:circadian clock protein KaiC